MNFSVICSLIAKQSMFILFCSIITCDAIATCQSTAPPPPPAPWLLCFSSV